MQLGVFLVFAIVLIAFVLIIGRYVSPSARIRRALAGAPRVTIAEFPATGDAKLVGVIQSHDATIEAPLTGRTCVYYEAVVQEYRKHGRSGSWRTMIREARGFPFAVDDGTGRAIVDPTGAHIAVTVDSHTRSGAFDDATPVEEAFLARHGMTSTGWFFNRKLRFREGVLELGEQVAILGRAVREPDPDAVDQVRGYRDLPATRLRLGGSPSSPLLISDDPSARR